MVYFRAFQNLTTYQILKFFPPREPEAISHLNEIRMHSGSLLRRGVGGSISMKFKQSYAGSDLFGIKVCWDIAAFNLE